MSSVAQGLRFAVDELRVLSGIGRPLFGKAAGEVLRFV